MKHAKNKSIISKPRIIIGLLVVVLLAGGAIAYYQSSDKPAAVPRDDSNIDFSPATESEKQDSEERKEDTAKKEENTPTPTPSANSVTPIIVDASQYANMIEVRSYVPDVYEDGGTCTFVFSKGSLQFTKESAAAKGATTTTCTNISVGRDEFSAAGQWSVITTYSSPTAQGNSQPKTFEVK